jgi:1-deoxy-D-xylulose-5-phosphate reductoisomerase
VTRPLNVVVLGATGSVGQQTLDVIDRNPSRLRLFGLTEGRRSTKRSAEHLIQGQAGDRDFDARVEAMVTDPRCDLVVVAIPGARALAPTMSALKAGKEVALATKEVLVMAGALVMKAAGERGIRPVDSEHSAIWQCLWGERRENVRRLILTASGGPFWAHPDLDLDQVTVEQALNHPRWSMGPKVTIDSATLMNKGFEVIEACRLFNLAPKQVRVMVHPQSTVHSMVEFVDGSILAQFSVTDMRLPILYALTYPERVASSMHLSVMDLRHLDFIPPDMGKFPCLRLAYEALEAGGGKTVALNAADEIAVACFLEGRIGFEDIPKVIYEVIAATEAGQLESISQVLEIDREARRVALEKVRQWGRSTLVGQPALREK